MIEYFLPFDFDSTILTLEPIICFAFRFTIVGLDTLLSFDENPVICISLIKSLTSNIVSLSQLISLVRC